MGLITSLRSKYELYRLEQQYTKRDKRTTFASGARYVDGAYVYDCASPTSERSWSESFASSGNKTARRVSSLQVISGGGKKSREAWERRMMHD